MPIVFIIFDYEEKKEIVPKYFIANKNALFNIIKLYNLNYTFAPYTKHNYAMVMLRCLLNHNHNNKQVIFDLKRLQKERL